MPVDFAQQNKISRLTKQVSHQPFTIQYGRSQFTIANGRKTTINNQPVSSPFLFN